MSILKVGSTNPDLSYVLQKNPNTILESRKPYTKEIRKGAVYGWFNEAATEFKMWFRDSDLESSFNNSAQGEFEYLDTTRYGSPLIPITIITNCLATALKKPDEHDVDGFEAYVTMTIKVPNTRAQEMLIRDFASKAVIESNLLYGDYYTVTIRAPRVYTVLNVAQIFCLMQCLSDHDSFVLLDKHAVLKYINCLNAVDAPYFVRYLFSVRAISNRDMFRKMLPVLQKEGTNMKFGNTRQQRFDEVAKVLIGGETLVDIGGGEMFYGFKLLGKYGEVFTIDADEELQDINRAKLAKRQIDNVIPLTAMATAEWVRDNEDIFEGADVLLTEVVEHMVLADAQDLIEAILKTKYRKLVITTPNKDFNQIYGMTEGETRHPDHHWELSYKGFSDWMSAIFDTMGPGTALVYGIGDEVNECQVTSMAVFEAAFTETAALTVEPVVIEIETPEPWKFPRSPETAANDPATPTAPELA